MVSRSEIATVVEVRAIENDSRGEARVLLETFVPTTRIHVGTTVVCVHPETWDALHARNKYLEERLQHLERLLNHTESAKHTESANSKSIPLASHHIKYSEFTQWLATQFPDSEWFIDGDPLLTSLLDLPVTTSELVDTLRFRICKDLLLPVSANGQPPLTLSAQRSLSLRWKESPGEEWILFEYPQE